MRVCVEGQGATGSCWQYGSEVQAASGGPGLLAAAALNVALT
jgi:hypothetical protein